MRAKILAHFPGYRALLGVPLTKRSADIGQNSIVYSSSTIFDKIFDLKAGVYFHFLNNINRLVYR